MTPIPRGRLRGGGERTGLHPINAAGRRVSGWVKRISVPKGKTKTRIRETTGQTEELIKIPFTVKRSAGHEILEIKDENVAGNIEKGKYTHLVPINPEAQAQYRDLRESAIKHLERLEGFVREADISMPDEYNENVLLMRAFKKEGSGIDRHTKLQKLLLDKRGIENRLLRLLE